MKMFRACAVLFLAIAFFVGCQSNAEKKAVKHKPVSEEKQPDPYEQNRPEGQNKYKSPDRGLGTLDYSRDAREATDTDTQNAEKALQETDQ